MVTTRTLTRCPVPMSKTSKVEVSVSPNFLVDTETALTPVGPLTWCRSLSKHMLVVETVFDGTNMVQRHRVKNTETWHCPDERHIQWLDDRARLQLLLLLHMLLGYWLEPISKSLAGTLWWLQSEWSFSYLPNLSGCCFSKYHLETQSHRTTEQSSSVFLSVHETPRPFCTNLLARLWNETSADLQKNYWFLWIIRMFPFMSYVEIKTHLEVVFPSEDVKWKGN